MKRRIDDALKDAKKKAAATETVEARAAAETVEARASDETLDIYLDTMVSNYNNAIQRQIQIEEDYKQDKSKSVAENESDQIITMLEKYQGVSIAEKKKC